MVRLATFFAVVLSCAINFAEPVPLQLRFQQETSDGSGRYHRLVREEAWQPRQTAVIVCDVWDSHSSINAVRRVNEFAPRLNEVVNSARQRGMTIIHAPSNCMDTYSEHPARRRAMETPKSTKLPKDIQAWCYTIPSEENGEYPVDQTDGGNDDDPDEHAKWVEELTAAGRNPRHPWIKQNDLVVIDEQRDYISDKGDEVWSILESRGIENVILTGVHTNMCVLGRPFGLRQMAKNGKNVVLMRDMTDTMYNPRMRPFVSHFTGTDLIVSHIERHVCPTVTSDQFIGGKQFRFAGDKRPHVAIVMAEAEYETNQTLPAFAAKYLNKDYRISLVYGSDQERNSIPGLSVLDEADVLLVSIRRRVLPQKQMAFVRRFVESGKPVIGIRTASHAFALRGASPPEGLADWPEFDAQVFGGNYHNHYGTQLTATIDFVKTAGDHPILNGIERKPFQAGGSLYRTSPLAEGAQPLLTGSIEGQPPEPIAWTFRRSDGGQSFYTSLGHKNDFENEVFVQLMLNAIHVACQ